MISKQDQKSWLKIECTWGHNARQCYEGLGEACGESALSYRTVALWVKAFRDGKQNVTAMLRPTVSEDDVQNVNALVLADQNITMHELANDEGLAHLTVLHILKK